MFAVAFIKPSLASQFPECIIPASFTLDNFLELFQHPELLRWTLNSLIVSILVTVIYVYICAMAGYAFALYDFKWKKILFNVYLAAMIIPFQVVIVPLYILCSAMKLNDTYAGIIAPALAAPFGVFLMKQFMLSFPYELVEAAKIDGYSDFKIFNKIVLPLSIPGISTLATFSFVNEWNSFLWPLIITESSKMKVLQAGISHLQAAEPMRYSYLMAAAAYSSLPVIIIFFVFQKYFLKSVKI